MASCSSVIIRFSSKNRNFPYLLATAILLYLHVDRGRKVTSSSCFRWRRNVHRWGAEPYPIGVKLRMVEIGLPPPPGRPQGIAPTRYGGGVVPSRGHGLPQPWGGAGRLEIPSRSE